LSHFEGNFIVGPRDWERKSKRSIAVARRIEVQIDREIAEQRGEMSFAFEFFFSALRKFRPQSTDRLFLLVVVNADGIYYRRFLYPFIFPPEG